MRKSTLVNNHNDHLFPEFLSADPSRYPKDDPIVVPAVIHIKDVINSGGMLIDGTSPAIPIEIKPICNTVFTLLVKLACILRGVLCGSIIAMSLLSSSLPSSFFLFLILMVSRRTSQYAEPKIPTSLATHNPTSIPGKLPVCHSVKLIMLIMNLSANGSRYVPITVAVDGYNLAI